VTLADNFPLCAISNPLSLTSMMASASFERNYSCLTILGSGSGVQTFTWANGTTSEYTFNAVITIVDGSFEVEQTGTITGGTATAYIGQEAIGSVILSPPLGEDIADACATNGLSSASGPYLFTIL